MKRSGKIHHLQSEVISLADNILQYESKIWATADLLRGSGIKESEWPSYMMPFFALIMIESRLIRLYEKEAKEAGGEKAFEALREDDRYALLIDQKQGYNKYLIEQKKTLKEICLNDSTFEIDFNSYLKGFDSETKDLLGVDPDEGEKFLNIKGIIATLKNKKVLFGYTKLWSEIDLLPFNNSEITTLEEHIKRKWADMSAETAGEQYTPDDVIALIAEILASKIEATETLIKIYDCTCGGGNLLFGVEDRLHEKTPYTQTYGQEWNDALYALAKIESRFRDDSHIEKENTLVSDKFSEHEFDVVVANPPYGVSWKGFESDIRKDKTGRYKYLPSVSDGQLLFMQHLISKMAHKGLGVVVHNGSTLFSGDAGSNESNIRKWMLDQDIVEAVIQLPTDEFFNTGIYTYLWVLNKNKGIHQKDKVMLLNASEKYKPLKKSKGSKRKEIDEASRLEIVNTLTRFADNDYARVFDKEFFYFNKQTILLTNTDADGKALSENIKLEVTQLDNSERVLKEFSITTFDEKVFSSLTEVFENDIKPFIDSLDYKEDSLTVATKDAKCWFDPEKETLVKENKGKRENLGCGKIVVKAAYKNKKQAERIEITVELTPDTEKDYEIIPFHKDEVKNKAEIAAFLKKYVNKPFEYLDNVVGVEINFNKVFYKPEQVRNVSEIFNEIKEINNKINSLEDGLGL